MEFAVAEDAAVGEVEADGLKRLRADEAAGCLWGKVVGTEFASGVLLGGQSAPVLIWQQTAFDGGGDDAWSQILCLAAESLFARGHDDRDALFHGAEGEFAELADGVAIDADVIAGKAARVGDVAVGCA